MSDYKYKPGDPVWHTDLGFCTVLRVWPLCPNKCLDVRTLFDDREVQLVLPADLQLVVPLAERFPEEAAA